MPSDSTVLFGGRDVATDEAQEAILVALEDVVAAWLNYCQHVTHITLDTGSGAELRDGEIGCTDHGTFFERDTGLCTFGPRDSAMLTDVSVTDEDGDVSLTDDAYEFIRAGPAPADDRDLTSQSNFEH